MKSVKLAQVLLATTVTVAAALASLSLGFWSATSLNTAQLPELRPAELWKYKALASASHRVDRKWNAACIEVNHSTLAGVTTDMLVWWFSEGVLDRSVQPACAGSHKDGSNQSFPNYLVWHPRDHASFTLERPACGPLAAGAGATIRIVEVLMARQPYLLPATSTDALRVREAAADDFFVNSRNLVTKLDVEGTAMEARLPLTGRAALRLTHEWADGAGGARLRSTLRLGAAAGSLHSPPLRMLLDVDKLGRRWIAHCVEEFGNLEQFLPALFHAAHSA